MYSNTNIYAIYNTNAEGHLYITIRYINYIIHLYRICFVLHMGKGHMGNFTYTILC